MTAARPYAAAYALAVAVLALAAPALAWEGRSSSDGGFQASVPASAAIKVAGGADAKPVLAVSCQGRSVMVTLAWPDAIPLKTNQHFVGVDWSLDGKARSSAMIASSGSASLGGSEAKEWLREMAGAGRLEVRVPDAHGGQTASFDLAGAKEVQAGLAKSSCG